jgi:N-acetyl-gamma-glutamyl-phosphate reductase
MIERYEQPQGDAAPPLVQVYGLNLDHPQIAEMRQYTGLRKPLFIPWVGHFRHGMLVSIPLHRDWLRAGASPTSVREALQDRYTKERLVSVRTRGGLVSSIALQQSVGRGVELFVEGNDENLLLLARLDNLGKGSAIAALQNMNLLLDCDEFAGIDTVGA